MTNFNFRNWSRGMAAIAVLPSTPPPAKTTLLFLRLDSAAVFLPVHLSPPTLSQLTAVLRQKFSSLAEAKVTVRASRYCS